MYIYEKPTFQIVSYEEPEGQADTSHKLSGRDPFSPNVILDYISTWDGKKLLQSSLKLAFEEETEGRKILPPQQVTRGTKTATVSGFFCVKTGDYAFTFEGDLQVMDVCLSLTMIAGADVKFKVNNTNYEVDFPVLGTFAFSVGGKPDGFIIRTTGGNQEDIKIFEGLFRETISLLDQSPIGTVGRISSSDKTFFIRKDPTLSKLSVSCDEGSFLYMTTEETLKHISEFYVQHA